MENIKDRCFAAVSRIPRSKVTTYGILAKHLGTSPRAVGQLLHRNTTLVEVPCHRVIHSDGRLGGYASGVDAKRELLRSEGIEISHDKVDLKKFLFKF